MRKAQGPRPPQAAARMMQMQPQQAAGHPVALQDYQMQTMRLAQQKQARDRMMDRDDAVVKRRRRMPSSGDGVTRIPKPMTMKVSAGRPMAMKKRLLHLLSTEIAINTTLYGELTAIHSTFDSRYSSFPHQTIETIMALFGFSETWRKFFKAFLNTPEIP